MNKPLTSILLNNLRQDFHYFSIFALILGIGIGLFVAGAKLLEMKQMDRWPAFFAFCPLFWLAAAIFDPKPEKARLLTQRFSLIFGSLSVALMIFIAKIL